MNKLSLANKKTNQQRKYSMISNGYIKIHYHVICV